MSTIDKKRSHDELSDEENLFSSPSKRPRHSSNFGTPYTPYPPQPSDSPTNPFGHKRTQRLMHSLPPVTSFSKHIPVRFQLVRKGLTPRLGGVHRVVQVPLNYTFTHLRSLVAFLFESKASYAGKRDKAGRTAMGDDEYLFEVVSKATMYSPLYKPGQIKCGTTTVKLSNVRDPCRWRSQYGYENEEDELEEEEEEEVLEAEVEENTFDEELEEKPGKWRWEDEEEYTLAHVWPGGLDILRGVIYHHSRTTQIHITINSLKVPERIGRCNTPYVFTGRGRVHLSPPPLPQPKFSDLLKFGTPKKAKSPPLKRKLRSSINAKPITLGTSDQEDTTPADETILTDTDADGDIDTGEQGVTIQPFDESHPFFQCTSPSKGESSKVLVPDSDDEDNEFDNSVDEDSSAEINPSNWNEPESRFVTYFFEFMGCTESMEDLTFDQEPAYDPFDNDDDDEMIEEVNEDEEENDGENNNQDDDSEEEESDSDEEEWEDDVRSHPTSSPVRMPSPPAEHYITSSSPYKSTPGLTYSMSSPGPSSPPSFATTPAAFTSPVRGSRGIRSPSPPSHPFQPFVLSEHYPNKKYTKTPAPPIKRAHRLRIERLQKRMNRLKEEEWQREDDEAKRAAEEAKKAAAAARKEKIRLDCEKLKQIRREQYEARLRLEAVMKMRDSSPPSEQEEDELAADDDSQPVHYSRSSLESIEI